MTDTTTPMKMPRITLRVSPGSLMFAVADKDVKEQLRFEPYVSKSGVSMAANLREAFRSAALLQGPNDRAQVLVDAPVLLVPREEYQESDNETLYSHSFPYTEGSVVMANPLPNLNCMALFAVNKDLKLVVDDHFRDVRFTTLMRPVWSYLHRRGAFGERRKLFAHFHDGKMEVFAFERNRFLFNNSFNTRNAKDAIYFILFVWKQLALDQQRDELYISGEIPEGDDLMQPLKKYVAKVSRILASSDFNRAPMTALRGITFDLLTLYLG